jgi:hypothetical protein
MGLDTAFMESIRFPFFKSHEKRPGMSGRTNKRSCGGYYDTPALSRLFFVRLYLAIRESVTESRPGNPSKVGLVLRDRPLAWRDQDPDPVN